MATVWSVRVLDNIRLRDHTRLHRRNPDRGQAAKMAQTAPDDGGIVRLRPEDAA